MLTCFALLIDRKMPCKIKHKHMCTTCISKSAKTLDPLASILRIKYIWLIISSKKSVQSTWIIFLYSVCLCKNVPEDLEKKTIIHILSHLKSREYNIFLSRLVHSGCSRGLPQQSVTMELSPVTTQCCFGFVVLYQIERGGRILELPQHSYLVSLHVVQRPQL